MSSATEYNAETYFFVIATLDKCALMNYVLNINEYNKLIGRREEDDLIRRYQAGELFNDDLEEEFFEDYHSMSELDLEEDLLPTQELEPEYPLTQYEELTNNMDLDAFFDLSDLPEFNLDEI